MPPDFSKKTVETLAKRAANQCSNPDCRTTTSGPSEHADDSINIGEAAHIYGARSGTARYRSKMTPGTRAEITNGIWLCKNCHKQVDDDELRYPARLLFRWRNLHEEYIVSTIGTPGERARSESINHEVHEFRTESLLAQQIIRDRPDAWEYSLMAALLDDYLKVPLRQWYDLSNGLYSKPKVHLSEDECFDWLSERMHRSSELVPPLTKLINCEFQKACGEPGVPGDAEKIRHVCRLIAKACEEIVQWEEEMHFVAVPDRFQRIFELHTNLLGPQIEKLLPIANELREAVDWAMRNPNKPRVFRKDIVIDLPDSWEEKVNAEMQRLERQILNA